MNDELTPDERAAMRARIVGGARDIAPVGAHRNAWIAGSIAAALVVAIAGAVVATSTLSAPQIANTPSPSATATIAPVVPTPTPTPSATPTPTEVVSVGRAPFDGDCANVLPADDLTSLTGHPMDDVTFLPNDSRFTIRGGIFCDWASSDEYKAARIVVAVLPSGQDLPMPESQWFAPEGCPNQNDVCIRSSSADGARVWVSVTSSTSDTERSEMAAAVSDEVLARATAYPHGVVATPTDSWWSPWNCADLPSSIDAGALGYDSVTVATGENPSYPVQDNACSVTLERSDATWKATATIVPGGAAGLDEMAASAFESTPVLVAGAAKAYWVELQSKYDAAAGRELWVTDGVNLLTVSGILPPGGTYLDATPDLPILLAQQLLAAL